MAAMTKEKEAEVGDDNAGVKFEFAGIHGSL